MIADESTGRGKRGDDDELAALLDLMALGFLVVDFVMNPGPYLDELRRANEVMADTLRAALGRDDIASGNVWPEEDGDE